jgi:hypothetical protein
LTVSPTDGSVAFVLAASVDPSLTTFTADLAAKAAMAASTTPASAPDAANATDTAATTQTP